MLLPEFLFPVQRCQFNHRSCALLSRCWFTRRQQHQRQQHGHQLSHAMTYSAAWLQRQPSVAITEARWSRSLRITILISNATNTTDQRVLQFAGARQRTLLTCTVYSRRVPPTAAINWFVCFFYGPLPFCHLFRSCAVD